MAARLAQLRGKDTGIKATHSVNLGGFLSEELDEIGQWLGFDDAVERVGNDYVDACDRLKLATEDPSSAIRKLRRYARKEKIHEKG